MSEDYYQGVKNRIKSGQKTWIKKKKKKLQFYYRSYLLKQKSLYYLTQSTASLHIMLCQFPLRSKNLYFSSLHFNLCCPKSTIDNVLFKACDDNLLRSAFYLWNDIFQNLDYYLSKQIHSLTVLKTQLTSIFPFLPCAFLWTWSSQMMSPLGSKMMWL